MAISVKTTDQSGGNGYWIGQLGQVQGWTHSLSFPGGPMAATFNFAAPFDLQHPALAPGRRLFAYAGTALVWAGRLEQPTRGIPWTCTCTGIAALAKNYAADSNNIFILNNIIFNAIYVGLPWINPPAGLINPVGTAAIFADTVDGVLGALVTQGGYWSLTPGGVFTTPTGIAAAPTLMLYATDVPGGRSFDNYGNHIIGTYLNSGAAGATAYVSTSATSPAITMYGRIDRRSDMTGLGQITTAQAQNAVDTILLRYAGGPSWTGTLTASEGQLFTIGGAPIDPAVVAPGVTVRVMTTNPDTWGAAGGSITDVPIGQVDYNDVARTATLTPLWSARSSGSGSSHSSSGGGNTSFKSVLAKVSRPRRRRKDDDDDD